MDHSERIKATWQDPAIRQRRIDSIKAAWTPEKRAEQSIACSGVKRKARLYSKEELRKKSQNMKGVSNPYFGKKHSGEARAKMQRPKGVIRLGLSAEEYQARLDAGLRWCIDCNDFRSGDEFNKRGFRRGFLRKSSICKKCTRSRWLMKAYGVTPEWYDATLAKQGGHCALCPTTEAEEGRPLSVDHNHLTQQVRGILCGRCNMAIERLEMLGWTDGASNFLIHAKSLGAI